MAVLAPTPTFGKDSEQPPEHGEAIPPGEGWHGEAMPDGMRKAIEKNVYFWATPAGLDIQMVYVLPGGFIMGIGNDPVGIRRHTHPMPEGFYIGRYETTWREYLAFCEPTDHVLPEVPDWEITHDHPVVWVSWDDAKAFCDWAGLVLPTEAQWEKAARGTDGRASPWGNEEPTSGRCVFGQDWPHYSTAAVGARPRGVSPYGAQDMAGNVSEWCADRVYGLNGYANPFCPERRTDAPWNSDYRPLRGGSFLAKPMWCHVAERSFQRQGRRAVFTGFRPVKNAE
ncbi:formylglycine-generating enzyme family protein [Planctomycetota bacterium]